MDTYEKKYKDALERAKKWAKQPTIWSSDDICQKIFPELAESDERIRKELLEHCINRRDGKQVCVDASDYRRWAAWLEKQGEPKSYSWKPTKEQYKALDFAHNVCPNNEKGKYYEGILESLIEDLHNLEKQGEQKTTKVE